MPSIALRSQHVVESNKGHPGFREIREGPAVLELGEPYGALFPATRGEVAAGMGFDAVNAEQTESPKKPEVPAANQLGIPHPHSKEHLPTRTVVQKLLLLNRWHLVQALQALVLC